MRKKIYKPIPYDEDVLEYVDKGTFLIQSARALDEAALRAVESNDTETLIRVAAFWMELAGNLEMSEDSEGEGPDKEPKSPIGFMKVITEEVKETQVDEEDD